MSSHAIDRIDLVCADRGSHAIDRIDLVCTNRGRHPERCLQNVEWRDDYGWLSQATDYYSAPADIDDPPGRRPLHDQHDQCVQVDSKRLARLRKITGPSGERSFHVYLCPSCRRTPELSDEAWQRMLAEARRAGVGRIDLSLLSF